MTLFDFLKDNGVKSVLDIGANVGQYTGMLLFKMPWLDVYMIEANPKCASHLHKLNVPFDIACLSDEVKKVKFYLQDNSDVGTGLSYYKENTSHFDELRYVEVETSTLDGIVKNRFGTKTFDFIKMDTQGSELDIIKGGMKTVRTSKFVSLEISLIEYNKGAPLKDEVMRFMSSIGFEPCAKIEDHVHMNQVIQEDWIFMNNG